MRLKLKLCPQAVPYTLVALALVFVSFWVAAAPLEARLIDAVKIGNIAKVDALLSAGADPSQRLADGSTALAWAVEAQNKPLVELLLSRGAGADVELTQDAERQNFSPLIVACQRGEPAIVKLLLDAGADVNRTTDTGVSALALCAGHADADTVKRLIALGADVDAVDDSGQSALMWAAANAQLATIELLLAHKAKLNQTSNNGFTPLFFAIKSGSAEAPQLLLDAGADADYIGPENTSAVQLAMYQKQYAVARVLIERGVDLDAFDRNGEQLLHAAIRQRQPQLVSLLLDRGAKPNTVTGESSVVWRYEVNFTSAPYIVYPKSPLLLAAEQGSLEMMQALVRAGSDTRVRAADGRNVVLAAAQSNPEALAYALELWPDANVTDKKGKTPLHLLLSVSSSSPISNEQMAAMFVLLEARGASIDIADSSGETPAAIATRDQFRAKADFAAVFNPNTEVKL